MLKKSMDVEAGATPPDPGARLDAAAQDSERRLRDVLDALPVAIYTTDADGRVTGFNEAAVRFAGRVPQLGADSWCVTWKLFWPDGTPMPHDQCPMAIALREGRPVHGVEAIAERPDGTRVHFIPYPTPLRDASGTVTGALNMFVDITEQRQAEEVRAKLAAIVDCADDAIVSKSLEGIITSWNRAAEKIFGYTAAEAVGRHISLIIPEERAAEEDQVLAQIRRGEIVDHFETVRRTKDGRRLNISLTVSPIKDAHGRIIGASKVARDITERKQAAQALRESEERLRSLVEQLREADRRKDEFIAMLAHELRNPIAALGLGVDLLSRAQVQDRKTRFAVPAIARQTRQLRRLADDLLDVARITHGKLTLQRQPVELLGMARSVAADFAARPGNGALIEVAGTETWVDGDVARVQQMVGNLVDNAIKYGGKKIVIRASREGPWGRLAVEDDGQGIARDLLQSLFRPFVQGAQPLDREQGGLGLGLALVDRLASLHGGSIEAQSDGPGKGSRFTASFAAIARPAAARASSAAKPFRRRVLVVEDEKDSREFLRLLLEADGHEVSLADNGADGLAQLSSFGPDIALVDVGLPGMDGYEVARRARTLPTGKQIKLIAITGYGGEKNRQRAKKAGFDLHVTKPVSYEELVRVFRASLSIRT
jgi:two-component system, chemotaxis family, CheB/CheR fusion protein